MIHRITKRATKEEVMGLMDPLIAQWFESNLERLQATLKRGKS